MNVAKISLSDALNTFKMTSVQAKNTFKAVEVDALNCCKPRKMLVNDVFQHSSKN